MKLAQMICLDEILDELEVCDLRQKSRSLGQISLKACEHYRPHFCSDFHEICLNKILDKLKMGDLHPKTRSLGQI